MLNNKTIAVIVPCYNEESQIGFVIETMPNFVDRIIVINDCSKDETANVVLSYQNYLEYKSLPITDNNSVKTRTRFNDAEFVLQDFHNEDRLNLTPFEVIVKPNNRIVLINHLKNGGKGAGIATGYWYSRFLGVDCVATMDGDGQMDPEELERICLPIVNGTAEYCKGNRLFHPSAKLVIPRTRHFGNAVLSILTKFATGFWNLSDTQTGYSAINYQALRTLTLSDIYTGYGYPNDVLVKLSINRCRVEEVAIKPVYNVGEESKMKIHKVIPRISWLLYKSFWLRITKKHFINDFHPLFLLYVLAHLCILIVSYYAFKLVRVETPNPATSLAFVSVGLLTFFSFVFAVWMDISNDKSSSV
jgi:glycosyltransferase involved in cell wall biosynthesis